MARKYKSRGLKVASGDPFVQAEQLCKLGARVILGFSSSQTPLVTFSSSIGDSLFLVSFLSVKRWMQWMSLSYLDCLPSI